VDFLIQSARINGNMSVFTGFKMVGVLLATYQGLDGYN
jgi:hypothetical protein